MPDPATACTRLMEADQAYHDLMRGAAVRSIVDENGESMSFTQGNRENLLGYIKTLAPQCPAYTPTALGGDLTGADLRGVEPMRFVF